MPASSRCWRDADGAVRLRVSALRRRNPCATHNGRTHDGPFPFRRRPARHPRQRRARRRHPPAASGKRERQRVRAQRQRRREQEGKRHQPLHRAHGLQGHEQPQLPADQPRRRAARRRRQRPHRQGPHRLPHARHGARCERLRAHARRHRPQRQLSRGRARARAPGAAAGVHRGRGGSDLDRVQAVRPALVRQPSRRPAGDRPEGQHRPLHAATTCSASSRAATSAPTSSSAPPAGSTPAE